MVAQDLPVVVGGGSSGTAATAAVSPLMPTLSSLLEPATLADIINEATHIVLPEA
jgi:hypothetical protein